jgi:hypothetical protein
MLRAWIALGDHVTALRWIAGSTRRQGWMIVCALVCLLRGGDFDQCRGYLGSLVQPTPITKLRLGCEYALIGEVTEALSLSREALAMALQCGDDAAVLLAGSLLLALQGASCGEMFSSDTLRVLMRSRHNAVRFICCAAALPSRCQARALLTACSQLLEIIDEELVTQSRAYLCFRSELRDMMSERSASNTDETKWEIGAPARKDAMWLEAMCRSVVE